jgi:hypothetical protein
MGGSSKAGSERDSWSQLLHLKERGVPKTAALLGRKEGGVDLLIEGVCVCVVGGKWLRKQG